jgi:hypothetical protein
LTQWGIADKGYLLRNSKGLESVIESSRKKEKEIAMREPGVAAVLSTIIPGVGQFYNGRFLAGILWLIITPRLWIGTGGLLGWVATSSRPTPPTPTSAIIAGDLLDRPVGALGT